jgi:outer membrane protein
MNTISKSILIVVSILMTAVTAMAQKYAFVDTQYILDNISEYKAAQQQLDQISINWQKEKRKREAEITTKEKEVKEFQKQKFGYDGELFKKKQELVKPIQDKIYNAVKKLAQEQSYAVIFDKSSDLIMLYTNPKYDKSDDILLSMGYKAGTKSGTDSKTGSGSSSSGTNMGTQENERPSEKK